MRSVEVNIQPRPQGILPPQLKFGENGPEIYNPIGLFKNALIILQYNLFKQL